MSGVVSPLLRVWRISPARHTVGALLTWFSATVPGLQVILTASLVDTAASILVSGDGRSSALRDLAVPLVGLFFVQVVGRVLTAFAQYLLAHASLIVRQNLADHTMAAGLVMTQSDYEDPEYYNRAKRALQEVQSDRVSSLPSSAIDLIASLVSIVSISVALFAWMPLAALLVLISPVPGAVVAALYGRKRWALDTAQSEDRRFAAYLQALTMSDQSHKEIAHYRVGGVLRTRFRATLQSLLDKDIRNLRGNHVAVTLADGLGILLTCAAIGFVLASVVYTPEETSLGALTGFVQGMNSLYGTTLGALAGVSAVYQISLYASNVFSFLDAAPKESGERPASRIFEQPPTIEFRNVSFRYPKTSTPVLKELSVSFPSGLLTVVVGANGTGKSSILKLLAGLYVANDGEILINTKPLASYAVDDLRASMGVMFQDYVKYELPLYDNVAFGNVDDYENEAGVSQALSDVGMTEKVSSLSNNWRTRLGRRFAGAEQLSIGQWQRLALARALRKDPSILLLDEPTASLDAQGERGVLDTLLQRRGRMTTILVSHSLAALRAADRVVFVDEGGTSARAPMTHDQLLQVSPGYRNLYERLKRNAQN